MPATTYLAPAKPVFLNAILEANKDNVVPSIDLSWEPFQSQIEAFLNAIDQYSMSAKHEIARRAAEHTSIVREAKADEEELERRINMEREKEANMLAAVAQERHVVADLTASLKHIQANLQRVKEQSAVVEAELNAVRKEAKGVRGEKERQGKALEEQKSRDAIELKIMQDILGLKIDGVKQNQLLMRFTMIDINDPDREFNLIIDVSKHEYSVPNCDPPLANMPELLSQLNADRDLYSFIKRTRKAFRNLVPNPPPASSKFDAMSGPGSRTAEVEQGLQGLKLASGET